VTWPQLLDLLFPPQCAGCNAFGTGLCFACAPLDRTPVRVALPQLRAVAYAKYDGALRTAVLALKDGRRDVAQALGIRIAPLIPKGSVLVPIPTTSKRLRVRGIDGVALIAGCAGSLTGAKVMPALQQRAGDTQRGRTRAQRLAVHGRFACDPQAVGGRRVLLVDDVCTTGATLADCAEAVREAGGIVEGAVVVAATKTASAWKPPMRG
jgi:predicted amidophosphoribosyltransferase